MFQNAESRFSHTVENYIRYRPGYPEAAFDFWRKTLQWTPQSIVADVGSGTGKSAEPLLKLGNQVFAVEPNAEMRQAAEQLLGHFPNFTSIKGSAEATTLPDQSIDFILAGTAFHWFEPVATRREFQRILKPAGWVLLMWNVRNNERSNFMPSYEDFLLKYSLDYQQVSEVYHDSSGFDVFFGNNNWQQIIFENSQVFDFEGLWGRYLSCSYALPENHTQFADAKAALRVIFDEHQENETVTLWYDTALYYGKLE
ncbi:MAG: class I SAM-dependent methyltransferase [Saprospiraceae bacterium]